MPGEYNSNGYTASLSADLAQQLIVDGSNMYQIRYAMQGPVESGARAENTSSIAQGIQQPFQHANTNNNHGTNPVYPRQNGQGGSQQPRTNGNSTQIKPSGVTLPTTQQTSTNAVGIDMWREQISKLIGLQQLQDTQNLPHGATISSYLVVPDKEKNPVLATTTSFVPYGRAAFKLPEPPKHVRSKSKEATKLQFTAANNPLFDPRSPAPSGGLNKEFIDFIQSPRVLDPFDQEEDEEEAKKFWICDPEVYKKDMESRRLNGKQQTLAKDSFVPVTAPNNMTHHPLNPSVISHPTTIVMTATQSIIKEIPPNVVVSSIQGKGTVIYKNMVYQSVPPSSISTTSLKIGSYGVPVIQKPRQTQPRATKITQVVIETPKLPTGGDAGKTRAPEKHQYVQKQASLEDDSMPTIVSCYSLNPKSPDNAPNTISAVPVEAIKAPGKTTLHIKIHPNAKSPLAKVFAPHKIGKSGRPLKKPKNPSSYDEAIATTIARAKEMADSQGASSAVDVANPPKRSSSASPRIDSLRNSDVTNGTPRHRSTETNPGQKTQKKNARMTTIKSGALKLPNPSPALESWFSSRQSTALGMHVVGNYPSPLIISKKPTQTPVTTSTNATQQSSAKVVSKKDPKIATTTSQSGLKIVYSKTLEIPRSSYVVTKPGVSQPEQKTATGSLALSDLRWSTTTTSSSKPSRAPPPYPFPPTVVQSTKSGSNYTVSLHPERSSSTDTANSPKPDLTDQPLDFSLTAEPPSTDDLPDEPLDYSMKTLRKLEEESRPQEKYQDIVLDLSVPKVRAVTSQPTNNAFATQIPHMATSTVLVRPPDIETPDISNLQTLCSVALSSESYAKQASSDTVTPSTKTGRKKQTDKKRNEKRNKPIKKRAPKAQKVVKQSTATNTGPERSDVVLPNKSISSRNIEPEIGSYLEVTRKQPVQSPLFSSEHPQNKAETVVTEASTRKVAEMQNVANIQAPHKQVGYEVNLKSAAAVGETVDNVVEVQQKLFTSIQKRRAECEEQSDHKSDTFTEQNDENTATEIQKAPEVTPTVAPPPSAKEVLPTVEKPADPKDIPETVAVAARPNGENAKLGSETSITEVANEAGDGGILSGLSMDNDNLEAKSEPKTTTAMEISQQEEQREGLEIKQSRKITENLYAETSVIASRSPLSLDASQSAESHIATQDSGASSESQGGKLQSANEPSTSPKGEDSTAAENEPQSVETSVVDTRDELQKAEKFDLSPRETDDFKLVNGKQVQSDAITFDVTPKDVDDVKSMDENQSKGGSITSDATVLEENIPALTSESTEEVHRMTAQKNALLDDISKGRNSPNVALCRLDSYEMRNNFSVVSNSEVISIRPESLKTIIKAKEESEISSNIENAEEKKVLKTEIGDALKGNTNSILVIGLKTGKITELPKNAEAAKSTDTDIVSKAEETKHDMFESEHLETCEKESRATDKEDAASQETEVTDTEEQVCHNTREENSLSRKEKISSGHKTESSEVDSIKVPRPSHQQTHEKVSKGVKKAEITTKKQQISPQQDDMDDHIEGSDIEISDESDDLVVEMKTPGRVFVHQRTTSENQEFFEMNEACCDEYDNMCLTEDEGDDEGKELHEKEKEILDDEQGKLNAGDIIAKKEMNEEEELEKVTEKRHEGAIENTQKELAGKNEKGIPREESSVKVQNDEKDRGEVLAVVSKDYWKAPDGPEKLKTFKVSKEETTENHSITLHKATDSKKEVKKAGLVEVKAETHKVKSDSVPLKRIKRRSAPRVSLQARNNSPATLKSPILFKRFGYGSDFSPMKRKTPLKLGYNTHADMSGCDIKIKRRKLVKKDESPSPKTPKISPKSSALTYILLSDSSDSSDETEDIFKTSKSKKNTKKSKKTSLSLDTKAESPQEKITPEAAVMPSIKEEPIDDETGSLPKMEEETKETDTAPEITKAAGFDSPERVERSDAVDERMTPRSSQRKRKPPKFLEETIYHDMAYECVTTPSDTNDEIPESSVFISTSPNLTEQENAPKSSHSEMAVEVSDKNLDERSSEKRENTQLTPSHDTEKTIKISSVSQDNSPSLTKQKFAPRSSSLLRKTKQKTQSVATSGDGNSTESPTQVEDGAEAVVAKLRAPRRKRKSAPRLTLRRKTRQSLTPKITKKGPLNTKNRRGRPRQLGKTVGEQLPGNGASKRKRVSSTDTLLPAVVVPPVVTNKETVPSYPQAIPIRLSSLKTKNTETSPDNSSDDVFAKTKPRRLSYSKPNTTSQSTFSAAEDSDIAAPPPNKIRLKSFVKDPYAPDSEDFGHITDASNGNATKKTGTDPFKLSLTGEEIQKPPKLKPKFQILNSSISKEAKKLSKKWKTFELITGIKVPNISPAIESSNPDSVSLKDVVDEILRTSPAEKPKPLLVHKSSSSTGILKKSSYTMVARTKVSAPRRIPRPPSTTMKSSITKKIHRLNKYQTARMKGNWKKAELHNVEKLATKPLPYHQPERLSKAERDENIYRTMQKLLNMGLIMDQMQRRGVPAPAWGSSFDFMKQKEVPSDETTCSSELQTPPMSAPSDFTPPPTLQRIPEVKNEFRWFTRKYIQLKPCFVVMEKLNTEKYCT